MSTPTAAVGVSEVLSNVALVNATITAASGVEQVKQVAEAVRACGGPDTFLQYLELVGSIRPDGPAAK